MIRDKNMVWTIIHSQHWNTDELEVYVEINICEIKYVLLALQTMQVFLQRIVINIRSIQYSSKRESVPDVKSTCNLRVESIFCSLTLQSPEPFLSTTVFYSECLILKMKHDIQVF